MCSIPGCQKRTPSHTFLEKWQAAGASCILAGMREVAQLLNDMRSAGVITEYALFGAVAQMRYTEPVATLDADVLVMVPSAERLDVLKPIYEFCAAKGYRPRGDAVHVGAWPVQFVPVFSPLKGQNSGPPGQSARASGTATTRRVNSPISLPAYRMIPKGERCPYSAQNSSSARASAVRSVRPAFTSIGKSRRPRSITKSTSSPEAVRL